MPYFIYLDRSTAEPLQVKAFVPNLLFSLNDFLLYIRNRKLGPSWHCVAVSVTIVGSIRILIKKTYKSLNVAGHELAPP